MCATILHLIIACTGLLSVGVEKAPFKSAVCFLSKGDMNPATFAPFVVNALGMVRTANAVHERGGESDHITAALGIPDR